MTTRKLTFKDDELLKELENKNKEIELGKKYNKKLQEYQNKLNKQGHKVQQLKDKIVPMVNERIKPQIELGEFEDLQTVEKNGKIVEVTVVDQLEEFKEYYRSQQESNQQEHDEPKK